MPRVRAECAFGGQQLQLTPVRAQALDIEAMPQLGLPLVAERGGRQDQRPGRRLPAEELRDDETGLYRFAEPDFIGDEQTRVAGDGSEHRLDLMRQDVRGGVEQRQGKAVVRRARDAAGEPCERLLTAHHPPARRPGVHDSVERREERAAALTPGDIEPHDVAVAGRAFDSPAPPANPDDISREEEGDSALFCHLALVPDWRNSNRRGRILRISAHEAVEVANGVPKMSVLRRASCIRR